MRPWVFPLELDSSSPTPVFVQIARAIAADVRRGRLRSGDTLPGSRELARALGVHRNTVVAAYEELSSQGWVVARPRAATVVASGVPDPVPRPSARGVGIRAAVPVRLGYELAARAAVPRPVWPPRTLVLFGGHPDVRLTPLDVLARAYRRALHRDRGASLAYGPPHGAPRLRAAVAAWLSTTRGLAARPESVLITRGAQMAIDLVARALL